MQERVNKKVIYEILDKLENKFPQINRKLQRELIRSFYNKSVDKVLEGKKISFNYIGEMKIYKREFYDQFKRPFEIKSAEYATHRYYYIVLLNFLALKESGTKYISHGSVRGYIKDKVIERNLDFPLYNKNEYRKINKHKKRSTEHV